MPSILTFYAPVINLCHSYMNSVHILFYFCTWRVGDLEQEHLLSKSKLSMTEHGHPMDG